MKPAAEAGLLRPLSLGEIFDRALTLYVRNFSTFTLITVVIVVPLAILQFVMGQQESASFSQLLAQIQHPAKTPPDTVSGVQTAWTIAFIFLAFVLNGFVLVTIAAAVGRLYRAQTPDWGACYRIALRRTGAICVTLLCELATFVLVIFAGAFAMGSVFILAFLLLRSSPALGVASIVAAFLVIVIWMVGIVLCYLAYAFALSALGAEENGVGSAIGAGFARIFNRTELLRATLLCLALVVIYFGYSLLAVSVAAVLAVMKLYFVYVLINALLSLVVTALLGILIAVYYFDVRVRREGLDMQAQIDSLQTLPSSP
jgi:hypothetical protein